jgi:cytidylate kinase
MGSGGTEIANDVALKLGLQYVDRQILFNAAKQAGAPEAALVEMDEFGILPPILKAKDRKAFTETIETVLREFARQDNVIIVGRGGHVVLNEWPKTLHLQIVAPLDMRVELMTKAHRIDRETALNRIMASDKARGDYLKRNYSIDWLNSQLYDLVINAGKIPRATAVTLIVDAVQSLG